MVGVVVYILMLADVFALVVAGAGLSGRFRGGWVGVALAGIAHNVPSDHEQVAINPVGVGAWFISVALGIVLMQGPASFAAFSAVATFVSACGLYTLFSQWARVSINKLPKPPTPGKCSPLIDKWRYSNQKAR